MPTSLRTLPPRRLLAIAASVFLFGAAGASQAQEAVPAPAPHTPKDWNAPPPTPVCALGSFMCPVRPVSYAQCRPNAMLGFYDPTLPQDTTGRDTAITYPQAVSVDGSDQTLYHFNGNVKIVRYDQMILADNATYNDDTTAYDAVGDVRYQEAGTLLQADHIWGVNETNHVEADNVTYQLLQSHGNGTAVHADMLDKQHSKYTTASYSTCDLGKHVWEFRGKTITIDKDTGVGVARSATMRYKNIPFLYLPYFTFPVDNRRKSGWLFPTFGSNKQSGYYIAAPYYFNLAPNYDATLTPTIYARRGAMLGGEFRYLTQRNRGSFDFQYLPNDRIDGGTRYLYKFVDSTYLLPGWSFGTSINRASDRAYFHDFANDLYNSSIGILSSNAYIYGGGKYWSTSFGADIYQNVDAYLPDNVVPYKRWPRATLNLNVPLERWLEFGMDNEAVAFRKNDLATNQVEGNRLDLYPYLKADFQGAYWFVRPKIGYRYTAYDLIDDYDYKLYSSFDPAYQFARDGTTLNQKIFNDRTPSRSLPIASLDTGLIFDRDTNLFGNSYTQTLEPRLYYLYVPYRNQGNLPLFDTALMSFDYWQLFSENEFSGADRQMDANNLTAAVTTRLLDDNGVERFSASLGQIQYLKGAQRVQAANQTLVRNPDGSISVEQPPSTDNYTSDYVAQATMQLNDDWKAASSFQWDPQYRRPDLGTFSIQRRLGTDGILNFGYRYRRQLPNQNFAYIEQFDASAVYPISDRWRVLGRWVFSKLDHRTLEALAGVEYENCCTKIRLIGRHYVSSTNPGVTGVILDATTRNSVMFEVEFKGLGTTSPQIDTLLHRDILGYQ